MKLFFSVYNNLSNKEKLKFTLIFIFILLFLFLELFSLTLLLPIIKIFFTSEKITLFGESFFFNQYNFNIQINLLIFLIVILFIAKNIFNAFLIYNRKKFLSDIQINFASRVYKYYLNQSYGFFLDTNKPVIIRNLSILAEYIAVLENFINIFIEFLVLILIIGVIFFNDVFVGSFIIVSSIIFTLIILKIFGEKIKTYGELMNVYQERLLNNYLDTLGSIKDIILQNKQQFFINEFSKNISKQAQLNIKNSFIIEIPRLAIEVLMVIGISSLMLVLLTYNKNPQEIIITLTFTIALLFKAAPSITRIIYQSNGLSFKIDVIKKVNLLLKSFVNKDKTFTIRNVIFNKIKLKNVNFNYKQDKKNFVFKNLELNIPKNKTIGIIGPSGIGKSTLLDLICCMLEPTSGGIYLDNKKIDEKLKLSWQNKISYISQKNYLLNGTISQNVAFAEMEQDIDLNRLNYAVRMSKLDSLVSSHKEGLNFKITDDGKNISGGQRQRIILARTIYRRSDIIILDEATSSLDNETEKEIMDDIMNNFHQKKTLIISTHKSKILYFADKIININDLKNKK